MASVGEGVRVHRRGLGGPAGLSAGKGGCGEEGKS